jgi:hypothetical protein
LLDCAHKEYYSESQQPARGLNPCLIAKVV